VFDFFSLGILRCYLSEAFSRGFVFLGTDFGVVLMEKLGIMLFWGTIFLVRDGILCGRRIVHVLLMRYLYD